MHILVIEDEEQLCRSMAEGLRKSGDHMILSPDMISVHPSAKARAEHQKDQNIGAGQEHRRERLMDPEESGCDQESCSCSEPVSIDFPYREQI